MKEIKYENKTIKMTKPLDECDFGKNPLEQISVANRFSGEKTMLPILRLRFMMSLWVVNNSEMIKQCALDWIGL